MQKGKKNWRKCLGVMVGLAMCSCTYSGFSKNYHGTALENDSGSITISCNEPIIEKLNQRIDDALILSLVTDGYAAVGYSEFTIHKNVSIEDAINKGKDVGACLILISSEFDHIESGHYPVFSYEPPAEYYTSFSGYYGKNYFSGSVVARESGGGSINTNYVPYSRRWDNYYALFLRKINKEKASFMVRDIPQDIRKNLGRNTGVIVVAVVEGTAAWNNNLLPGDVVVELNGNKVLSSNQWAALFKEIENREEGYTNLKVLREGQMLELEWNWDENVVAN